MGYFLPLYKPHPIFDFLPTSKTERDLEILRDYFESGDDSDAIHLFEECDNALDNYLEELLKARRRILFNAENKIPDEKAKVDEQAEAGNKLAAEMKKILDTRGKIPRTWPIREIEGLRQKYAEWRKISKMPEQAYNYLLYGALKVLYYPNFFFEQEIFKLEENYRNFKYDFIGFAGQELLYMVYLIHKREGTERVFDNLQDFIINRYIPKPVFGIDAISLLTFFLWGGNDVNKCNRFFTRRMKDDIYRESEEHTYLTNNMMGKWFEDAFEEMFYSDRSAPCKLENPFRRAENKPGLIEQAVLNHLIGNYSAAVNLLFPLIEGIIWDISVAEHLRNGDVYTKDSDLTTRDVRRRTLLGKDGSPIGKPYGYPTLKDLLESTKMNDIINTDFLKMLIQEMYPVDRNPILHGGKLDYNDPWQSSRMLLMLEYLHHLIEEHKYLYPEQLDETGYWTPRKNKERPPSRVRFCSK